MILSYEFSEFYFSTAFSTSKPLFECKNLVTSRLYTERKTDALVWAKSIYFPCQVQVNDTIYLIGGYNDNDGVPWSRQVFTYSTINGLISVLPEMIAYQNGHSCTSFNNGSHTLIVSVGGENLGGGDNMIYNPHNVTQIMVVGEHIWELGIILILLFEIHFIFFWN